MIIEKNGRKKLGFEIFMIFKLYRKYENKIYNPKVTITKKKKKN